MSRFILRRLLLSIPVLLGVIFVVFALARLLPGDPCRAALGERATEEICDAFNARYGLHEPIPVQFGIYLRGLATGDLGTSIKFGRPVSDLLIERLPLTLELALVALVFAIVAGVLLGLASAYRRNSAVDVGSMMLANFGVSIPVFVLGLVLAYVFSVLTRSAAAERLLYTLLFALVFWAVAPALAGRAVNAVKAVRGVSVPPLVRRVALLVAGLAFGFGVATVFQGVLPSLQLPPSGRLPAGTVVVPLAERWGLQGLTGPLRGLLDFFSNMYTVNFLLTFEWAKLFDTLRYLLLPAIALGTIPMAIIARITRSSLLDVLGLDYIRTARAKGLGDRLVVFRHAMRNALLPVVTVIGLQLGALLGGAILTETVFNLTGIGRTVFEAITGRDYAVIQATTLIIAVGYIVVNLVVDVLYAYLDPRIRLA